MRSKRPAPQFWPRIGPTAPESANRPPKATGDQPVDDGARRDHRLAEAGDDRRSTKPLAIGVATLVRIAGSAIANSGARVAQRRRSRGRATSRWIAHRAPGADERRRSAATTTVAIAAPSMPRPRPKIRSGSSPAVTIAARQRHIHGALGVADRPQDARERHAERHQHVRRQRDPEEALGDRQRLGARAEERAGSTAAAAGARALTTAPRAPRARRQELASRRACSKSPAPSARDTSAPTAIISPTLIEMARNRTIVASPTPAVSARIAEPGDVEQRQKVDDEDGDEPDRARRRSSPGRAASSSPVTKRGPSPPAGAVDAPPAGALRRGRVHSARLLADDVAGLARQRARPCRSGASSGSGSRRVPPTGGRRRP